MQWTLVVLPIPLRPMRATTSPRPISKVVPNSTWLRSYAASIASTLSITVAQISPFYLDACPNDVRGTARNPTAVNQNSNAISQREDGVHVVLDKEDRVAPLQRTEQLNHHLGLAPAHARHRL